MAKQNNLPPPNVKPVDLVAEFMARPRPHRKVESPLLDNSGKKIEMTMWILTHREQQICLINAEKFTTKLLREMGMSTPKSDEKSEGYHSVFDNRIAAEVLSIACRKNENIMDPCFLTAEIISAALSTDQIAVLYNTYLLLQKELGPIVSKMEQYEMDAWVDVIQKGGAINFLASTTLEAKIQFLQYLASQLSNLPTDNSSSSTPQSSGSENKETNKISDSLNE